METDFQLATLWARIEHFVKNKMQGLFGGSFLVESGLRSSDLEAIRRGWQIVSKNQVEIARCIQHLVTLGQPPPNHELCRTAKLVQETIEEFEDFAQKDSLDRLFLFQPPEDSGMCWVEPQTLRYSLFGLLRICYEAGLNSPTSTTQIRVNNNSIHLVCNHPKFDLKTLSNLEIEFDQRLREVLLIEWHVAQFSIARQLGKLSINRDDSSFEFQIELPLPDGGH